jgi:hypothetical protein
LTFDVRDCAAAACLYDVSTLTTALKVKENRRTREKVENVREHENGRTRELIRSVQSLRYMLSRNATVDVDVLYARQQHDHDH